MPFLLSILVWMVLCLHEKAYALLVPFPDPVTCLIYVPMLDNQSVAILPSVDSFSPSVLFFPCANTAV
jgi:hypothetical protein